MTIQDELAPPWFQPVVPSEAHRPRPNPGPPTTRIAGQLPLDEVDVASRQTAPPLPPLPPMADAPSRVEVTQPYIPAIRDEQPEFAKRLNPEPPQAPVAAPMPPQAVPSSVPQPTEQIRREEIRRPEAKPQAPVRKRSLMRRVVRRIIGPDLLRKDPPKKKR